MYIFQSDSFIRFAPYHIGSKFKTVPALITFYYFVIDGSPFQSRSEATVIP